MTTASPAFPDLDRYIDRFLLADGWRVSGVDTIATPGLVEVTISRESATSEPLTVTRSATSAGEAAFKACSSARKLALPVINDEG